MPGGRGSVGGGMAAAPAVAEAGAGTRPGAGGAALLRPAPALGTQPLGRHAADAGGDHSGPAFHGLGSRAVYQGGAAGHPPACLAARVAGAAASTPPGRLAWLRALDHPAAVAGAELPSTQHGLQDPGPAARLHSLGLFRDAAGRAGGSSPTWPRRRRTPPWYGRRTGIAAGCKALKRGGFGWQRTRMTDPDRAARRWRAMASAIRWLLSMGGDVAQAMPPPKPPCRLPRRRRATCLRMLACFRLGDSGASPPASPSTLCRGDGSGPNPGRPHHHACCPRLSSACNLPTPTRVPALAAQVI